LRSRKRIILLVGIFFHIVFALFSAEDKHSHSGVSTNTYQNFATAGFTKEYELLYASIIGDEENVKALLKAKVNPNVRLSPKEYEYLAKQFFKRERFESDEAYADFCKRWQSTPLIVAVARNHLECVKLLIKAGANFTDEDPLGETAFLCAAKIGNIEMINYLYLHGGQINHYSKKYHQTPLYVAAANKNTEVVQWLLEHRADASICDEDGISPAFLAVQNNDIETLKVLISYKTNIDIPSVSQITPLLNAVFDAHLPLVKLLVEAGADVNYKGIYGITPVIAAGKRGEEAIFEYLINKNADVNCTDESGQSAFMLACKFDEIAFIKTCIKRGGNINQEDDDGNTPIFYAIQNNQIESVKFLAVLGADVNHVNAIGITPLMLAINMNEYPMIELLLSLFATANYQIN